MVDVGATVDGPLQRQLKERPTLKDAKIRDRALGNQMSGSARPLSSTDQTMPP